MLSVKQLLYNTLRHRRSILEKASSISVSYLKMKQERDEDGSVITHVTAKCTGDTVPREVNLSLYGWGPEAKVWCSCDCPYFLYHTEVALMKRSNSDIIFSNGRTPRETNPGNVAHLCKHCAALLLHPELSRKMAKPTQPAKRDKQKTKPGKVAEKFKRHPNLPIER